MGFSIEFDYRFDEENFFTPQRRAVLEEAARIWSDRILDDFDEVAAGHEFTVTSPYDFESTTLVLDRAIDDLLIFPSATDLDDIDENLLALASPDDGTDGTSSGFDDIGTIFERRIEGVGTPTDFEPWLGGMVFNTQANWSFDDSPGRNQSDFLSVALHEIGHVLGLGTAPAFDARIVGGEFMGPNVFDVFGDHLPLEEDGAHVHEEFTDILLNPFSFRGERLLPSAEDFALLADIGYEIDGLQKVGAVPDLTSSAADTVFGTFLADRIDGQSGADNINGRGGDDTLHGGTGADTLDGQDGNDVLRGETGHDQINGGQGNDLLQGGAGNDELDGHTGDDTLFGEAGNDWLRVTSGANALHGATGNDTLESDSRGNDTLLGGDGNDNLVVEDGRNVLDGGAGDDALQGGDGQDSFVFGLESGNDLVTNFEAGQDILVLENSGFTRARQVLASLDETADDRQLLTLADGSSIEMSILPNADGSLLAGKNIRLRNDEGLVIGSVDADVMRGDGADNFMRAFADSDTLLGAAGDDTLDGGSGADLLNGGPGSDIIYVDDAGDRVAESRRWDGEDTVISSVNFRMGRSHIENLELTGAARLGAGNGLRNQITGNDADNVLDGGGNVDTLTGGDGDDRYFIRSPGDSAVEAAGGGTDTVLAFRAHKLEANIENLFLQTVRTRDGDPVQGINGIGNDLNNVIVGNPFDNMLSGRGGRDTLKGQGGADTFVFDQAPGAANADRVVDFDASEGDAIWLRGATFGLERGALAPGAFRNDLEALDAGDRVIFNEGTGQLWFDADGAGGAPQHLVATFLGGAVITAADIEII